MKKEVLENGYTIRKCKCYDDFNIRYLWNIFSPDGRLYLSCCSYSEAYELASHLVMEAN